MPNLPNPLDGRMLVEALPLPVLVLDPDGVVLAANASAISALMAAPTPVGKNFKDVVTQTVRGPLARAIADAKRHGGPEIAAVDGAPTSVQVLPLAGC